jgi:hypothetical protein
MNKYLRSFLVFLLSAALLVGVVALAYLLLPNVAGKSTPASTATPAASALQAVVPSGWLVYTDPAAGFSFSYPPDAHLETGSNDLHPYNFIRVVFKDPLQDSLVVDVQANNEKSLPAQFAAQAYEESASQPAPKALMDAAQTEIVGNKAASKYVIPPTLTDFILYVPLNDKMVVIYPARTADPASGQTPVMDLFNQVLGTFEFPGN